MVGPRRIHGCVAPERCDPRRLDSHPGGQGGPGRVFPGQVTGDLAESRLGAGEDELPATVGHVELLRPGSPCGPRERAVLVFIRHRDVEPDRPVGIQLDANLDAPFVDDPVLRPYDGHHHVLVEALEGAIDLVPVAIPAILDDGRSAPGMGRIDVELAAILGVPRGVSGAVEDDGIVPHLDGDIEGAFGRVVGESKVGFQVVLAAELVAVLDAFDGQRLQTGWPVAQVAVDGDPFRRKGDADGAVLSVRRARADEDRRDEEDEPPVDGR